MNRVSALLCRNPWLWTLPPLLLAAALATSQLDNRSFAYDEMYSLFAAGARLRAPHAISEVWNTIAANSPEQALGWPVLLSVWVRFSGWSEVAVRALPLFAGLLALACAWRVGRDLFAPSAGLAAVLLLSTSGFYIGFMRYARAFSMVALFALVVIWYYWRIVLHPGPAKRACAIGLLLASIALCYMHYFAALLLPTLTLFHLLFVRRNGRCWWLALTIFALAALTAALQLPVFLQGLESSLTNANVKLSVMSVPETLSRFLNFLGNNTLFVPAVSGWLALVLLLALPYLAWRRGRGRDRINTGWFIVFTFATLFLLYLAANELVGVLTSGSMRYLMPLWPLAALLVGLLVWRGRKHRLRLAEWALVGMIVTGLHASNHPELKYSFNYGTVHLPLHLAYRELQAAGGENDLLLLRGEALPQQGALQEFYIQALTLQKLNVNADGPKPALLTARQFPRVWVLQAGGDSEQLREAFTLLPEDAIHCGQLLDLAGLVLELYAWTEESCTAAAPA